MNRYRGADLSFDVPTDWEDKSVVAFSAPAKPGAIVPNVVLSHDKLKPKETLDAYCDRTIVDMVKNLANFKLRNKEPRSAGDKEVVYIELSWSGSSGKTVVQRMWIFEVAEGAVAGLNVTCDLVDDKRIGPIADRIFDSLEFEG